MQRFAKQKKNLLSETPELLIVFKPIKIEKGKHRETYKSNEAAHRLTVLLKTTLWPFPTLSMWVARLRQMALWRIASMVWASKKSWGLATDEEFKPADFSALCSRT